MISLVKYKIKYASNIVIDTETFKKQVDDDITPCSSTISSGCPTLS